MEAALAHLTDFSKPFDHVLLDSLIAVAMDGKQPKAQRENVETLLLQLRSSPDMWRKGDTIIDNCTNISTKIYACTIFIEMIQTRWRIIPTDQKDGLKLYVLTKIVNIASSVETAKESHLLLAKLNETLVYILKQEWPHNWPTFIQEMVMAAQASESLCENCMLIFKLLSEEIFEFSKDQLTSTKARLLKEQLTEEFSKVFQLCEAVLGSASSPSLFRTTLVTLQRFLTWIPVGYIFETSLIPALISNFLPTPLYRSETMLCLIEITNLPLADLPSAYYPVIHGFLDTFLTTLQTILPRNCDLTESYESQSAEDNEFIAYVAQFLGSFLQNYYSVFEENGLVLAHQGNIHMALEYLIMISRVDDDDLYKVCLDFWNHFARDMHTKASRFTPPRSSFVSAMDNMGGANPFAHAMSPVAFVEDIIQDLRTVTIDHMAKPEEVIIVPDENGDIVREKTKDSEVLVQYKTMRDTIIYLTHLNNVHTTLIMLEKLEQQVQYNFTHKGLNTLCWAIGSISGAMSEQDEKTFLISVIRDLLKLCEDAKGKNNKAVVASNIMYIVGQYPRFLRAHWKFLKTVVNKLFEFMHEPHPGVQDMSCDTFLKISQKCKRKFITSQPEDAEPFIITLIRDLSKHTQDLQPHQVQSFYESVATIISDKDAKSPSPREELMVSLMEIQNEDWMKCIALGRENPAHLVQENVAREILRILRLNNRVCMAAGSVYIHQLANFFNDASTLYRLYTEAINEGIKNEGDMVVMKTAYKALRAVKNEFLDLMSSFFSISFDLEGGAESCIPLFLTTLLSDVLADYSSALPVAREAKVLTMLSSAVTAFKHHLDDQMPDIMAAVFEPTLALITSNMTDHYEHRIGFFSFLRAANEHCFSGLFSIPAAQQKLIIESIIWAFKHVERNISETGLEILVDLLRQVNSSPAIAGPFYQTYMLQMLKEILAVFVDGQHKGGFKLHSQVIMMLCHATVQDGLITVPISADIGEGGNNALYVKQCIETQLVADFPNVSPASIGHYVMGLFDVSKDQEAFKVHLRDFLITSKEYSREDSELFLEEIEAQERAASHELKQYRASVRGLLRSDEIDEDDVDLDRD